MIKYLDLLILIFTKSLFMRIKLLFILFFMSSACSVIPSNIEIRRSELEKIINSDINGERVNVVIQGNTILTQFSNGILFDFDKYQVKKQFIPTIQGLSSYLNTHPSISLIIEGHTDKAGKAGYNRTLSLKRANAVKSIFTSFGVSENRIKTIGQGENKPIPGANDEENRRVVIIFLENIQIIKTENPLKKVLQELFR